jgi:tetratricopeptide (TPR) repeat protein
VQHAHQKGIIHRDLKPSNVLIALYDGRPVPKVIDFGVAKATGQKLTERTMFTEVGSIVGTLEYMAPEQAELNNLDIDTRADIYSLGVLLYELLTGSPPFTSKQLRSAAFTEMLRMIKEVEPPKPSTKLSSSEELPSIAAKRKLEPKRLTKIVSGDLDWIVMKCLEKERGRRYETANGLAMDVQRHLTDEPVTAGPPSAVYRMRKFVRRNKGAVMATGLVFLALVGGIVGATWGLLAAQAAANRERDAKESALKRLGQIEKGADILGTIFQDLDPYAAEKQGKSLQVVLGERLDQVAAQLDAEAVGDPLTVARLQFILGGAQRRLGYLHKAVDLLTKARMTREALLGLDHQDTVSTIGELAMALREAGRTQEAIPMLEESLRRQRETRGPADTGPIVALSALAQAYRNASRLSESIPLSEEAVKLAEATLGPKHLVTINLLNELANGYQDAGRRTDALQTYEKALAQARETLGPTHPTTAAAMGNLAISYEYADRLAEAMPLFEEGFRNHRKNLGATHPNTLAAMTDFGRVLARSGKTTEGLALLEEALKLTKESLGARHPDVLHRLNVLSVAYEDAGREWDALPLHEELVKLAPEVVGPKHSKTLTYVNNLAMAYRNANRFADALPHLKHALELAKEILGPKHPNTVLIMNNLGLAYQDVGQFAAALPLHEEALRLAKEVFGRTHSHTIRITGHLVKCHMDSKQFEPAEKVIREWLSLQQQKEPDAWTTYNAQSILGRALLEQKKYAEAEPFLLQGHEGMAQREAKIPPKDKARLIQTVEHLVQLYDAWGKPDKAAEWRAKLPPKKPEGDAPPPDSK